MKAVEHKALAYRLSLSQLCHQAGLSRTIAYRWQKKGDAPLLPTIGRLEDQLVKIEAERRA